jgi:hypothetical protein
MLRWPRNPSEDLVNRSLPELCLAHFVGNAVECAYRRTDLFDKRRDLMDQWARFCYPRSADVIEIGVKAWRFPASFIQYLVPVAPGCTGC